MPAGFRQLRKLHQPLRQRQGKKPMHEHVCECVMKTSLIRLHVSMSVTMAHLQCDYTVSLRCIMRSIPRRMRLNSEHPVLACMTCRQGHMPKNVLRYCVPVLDNQLPVWSLINCYDSISVHSRTCPKSSSQGDDTCSDSNAPPVTQTLAKAMLGAGPVKVCVTKGTLPTPCVSPHGLLIFEHVRLQQTPSTGPVRRL